MAQQKAEQKAEQEAILPEFTERDMKKARAWFKKAADTRERRDYDYAIECYITGLNFWPEAVEEGHQPLHSTSVQRKGVGGKKPGMMESMRKSMTGKDFKKAMLNAETLLAKDPGNASYLDGLMKNAAKGGFLETLKWVTPMVLESLKKDKKPNSGRFKTFRETLAEAGDKADEAGRSVIGAWFYEQAVNSLDYLMARNPGEDGLRNEQRDYSGRLTILKGKYAQAETFRDSIQDAESQKLLHDADRVQQGDSTLEALIAAKRKDHEADPTNSAAVTAYVDALLRRERKDEEDQAVEVLLKAYEDTKTYNFKSRADEIRLRQLKRLARKLVEKARQTGDEADKDRAKQGALKVAKSELKVYRERVAKYPTDLRLKFMLGKSLFDLRHYDEAIPVLQEAQQEPRSRTKARVLMGRAFLETGAPTQAREVLKEALEEYETVGDDTSKELLRWLGAAHAAAGEKQAAEDVYGRLLRMDYNYGGGQVRKELDALKAQ